MPSKSKAQHNLMMAVAHNPKFAKKTGIPQSVGKEFAQADKGHTPSCIRCGKPGKPMCSGCK